MGEIEVTVKLQSNTHDWITFVFPRNGKGARAKQKEKFVARPRRESVSGDDDDVYYYIGERLKLERKAGNMGV